MVTFAGRVNRPQRAGSCHRESDLLDAGPRPGHGASWPWQLLVLVSLLGTAVALLPEASKLGVSPRLTPLVHLGLIGCWRWTWGITHYVRAAIYRYWLYPRLRQSAERAVAERGPVSQVDVIATTYHERAWITRAVVRSLVDEFHALTGQARPPRLVMIGGCDEDDRIVSEVFAECVDRHDRPASAAWPPQLTLLRGDRGKRSAISLGLDFLARHETPGQSSEDGVVVLMDGDTAWSAGLLAKVLPLFRLSPGVAAVTTNERSAVAGPVWFSEWLSLRFGQRHLYMCSLSFSDRLLCLTGRLSVFRAGVATDPSFREQIEKDGLEHWLFGRYDMLSGDDKSTWYWLASRGRRMLYVPDAMVTTFEVIGENPLHRALANMRRWSGNMLRNSRRAIWIGPGKLGLFPWLCTIDQSISFWTVLIGPLTLLLSWALGRYDLAAAYVLWLLATRTLRSAAAWRHGRRFSACYIPLQLCSEWVGAVVKMWVFFHPVKQNWLNRGKRTLDSSRHASFRFVRRGLATYFYAVSFLLFAFGVGLYSQLVPFVPELPLILGARGGLKAPAAVAEPAEGQFWGKRSIEP